MMDEEGALTVLERWFTTFGYAFFCIQTVFTIIDYETATDGMGGLALLYLPIWIVIGGVYLLLAYGVRKRHHLARIASSALLPVSIYLALMTGIRMLQGVGIIQRFGQSTQTLTLWMLYLSLFTLPFSIYFLLFDRKIKDAYGRNEVKA